MSDPAIPTAAEREALNAALLATGTDTGFWDDNGRPAPWPDDIDQWTRTDSKPTASPGPGRRHVPAHEPMLATGKGTGTGNETPARY